MPGFIGQYEWLMSALKLAGSRLTGAAPVGSFGSAGRLSSAGGLVGFVAEGAFALFVQPAQMSVAASTSGHVCRGFISSFLPESLAGEDYNWPMKNR